MADFYNKLRVVNKRELIRVDVAMQEQWVENRTNPEVVIQREFKGALYLLLQPNRS